jgi:hypothetical protein
MSHPVSPKKTPSKPKKVVHSASEYEDTPAKTRRVKSSNRAKRDVNKKDNEDDKATAKATSDTKGKM